MIDFRYHIVSIVAIFLALGIGIVLGTTTLNGPILDDLQGKTNNLAKTNGDLQSEVDALQSRLAADHDFASAVLPYAVKGRLADQRIALVSGPGVGGSLRQAVTSVLTRAGAEIVSDVQLRNEFTDPAQDSTLASLAGRLAGEVSLPGGSGLEQASTQLASVLVTGPDAPANPPDALRTSLDAYGQAQMLTVHGDTSGPGTMAVVLAAAPAKAADAPSPVSAALLSVTTALDKHSAGAVLAGTEAAGAPNGVLDRATHDASFGDHASSVPAVDQPSGQIALVFALELQLKGKAATYPNPAAAVSAAPDPTATPSPTGSPTR